MPDRTAFPEPRYFLTLDSKSSSFCHMQMLGPITAIVLLSACASEGAPAPLAGRNARASEEEESDASAGSEAVPDAGQEAGEAPFTGEATCAIRADFVYAEAWSNRDFSEALFPTQHTFVAKITSLGPDEVRFRVDDAAVSANRSVGSDPAYRSPRGEMILIGIQPPIVQAPTRLDSFAYRDLRFTISGRQLSGEASAYVRYAHLDYVGNRPAKATFHCELIEE